MFDSGGTATRVACGRMIRLQRADVVQADSLGRLPLALRNALDRRADDLRGVAADVEGERDHRGGERVDLHARSEASA